MKKLVMLSMGLLSGLYFGCQENETNPSALTGKSVSYSLFTGDEEWGFQGEVTFSERVDGLAVITFDLSGPRDVSQFPAHLHYGSYSVEADIASMLTPIDGGTGRSETLITQLANGQKIAYSELLEFNGHIKIHLGDGDNKNVILAYGNIGSNPSTVARANLANCASW